MSKTFYADGQTGKVAIMKGEFSQTVLDNPQANTDKLYFHSGLNYIEKIGHISGSFTCPEVSKAISSTTHTVATIAFPSGYAPVVFAYLNGVPCPDPILVYNNQNSSTGNYSVRFITALFTLVSGTFSLIAGNQCLAYSAPAYSGTLSAYIYGYKGVYTGNETINITPTRCIFGNGKFDSDNYYAKLGGTYPVYGNSPAFTFSKPSTGYVVNVASRSETQGLSL